MKIENIRIDKKKFEAVCKEITEEKDYVREKYLHITKDKIITHYLRIPLQHIAQKYIPHRKASGKVSFPAELVIKIANKMDLYVTDIVVYK
jgi:hypothetical protein